MTHQTIDLNLEGMATFTPCLASAESINRAAKVYLNQAYYDSKWDESLDLINSFRSGHGYPLQAIKMTLKSRARSVDPSAVVAQRLKRLSSIAIKLRNEPKMQLSQMQDIGGCRAVVRNWYSVIRLLAAYRTAAKKNPTRSNIIKEKDYISQPKTDGYRSFHYVLRYQSTSEDNEVYNGKKIEIQIRSRPQHVWATAVEMAQTFTGRALKSKIKTASEDWQRFFAVMSSAMAAREKCTIVPGTPKNKKERKKELKDLEQRLNVIDTLSSWGSLVEVSLAEASPKAEFLLLILDVSARRLEITPFANNESLWAQEAYLREEKSAEGNDQKQVVLVSVDSLDML